MRSAWKVWLMGALVMVMALALANCNQGQNEQMTQAQQQLRTRLEASIQRIDTTIDMLEDSKERGSDVPDAEGKVDDNMRENREEMIDVRITALKQRQEILRARLDSLETVSEEQWDAYQSRTERDLGDVDTDLREYDNDAWMNDDTVNVRTGDTVGMRRGTGTGTGTGTDGR